MAATERLAAALACCILLPACATMGDWTPTVDTAHDPHANRLNRNLQECRQLALQASGGTTRETMLGAGIGGLIGAAGGAALGAALGSPGTGAAFGAALGGIGGGAKQGFNAEDSYKHAYSACLRQRGHKVLN